MDWKREAKEIQRVALEHKRKMETDPEYQKKVEKLDKKFDRLFLETGKKKP